MQSILRWISIRCYVFFSSSAKIFFTFLSIKKLNKNIKYVNILWWLRIQKLMHMNFGLNFRFQMNFTDAHLY